MTTGGGAREVIESTQGILVASSGARAGKVEVKEEVYENLG